MKNLAKQSSKLLLLCAFLFSSLIIAEAAPSTKETFFEPVVKRESSASENTKVLSEGIKPAAEKKSRSKASSPKKANSLSREKEVKSSKKKEGCFCSLAQEAGDWECFKGCLTRNVPPELVAHCADACARGDWGTCAGCLGIGITVVVGCAWECGYIGGNGGGGGYGIILP